MVGDTGTCDRCYVVGSKKLKWLESITDTYSGVRKYASDVF